MSRYLQPHRRLVGCSSLHRMLALLAPGWIALSGCGSIGCPEGTSNIDGLCQKVGPTVVDEPEPTGDGGLRHIERCDGLDNDGDDAIDEDWPSLGEPCGEARGECKQGRWVCEDATGGVVCDGAVGPVAEVCDGLDNDCDGVEDNGPTEVCDGEDNDCDGLIDEEVLSIKQEHFDDHVTVAAIEGGFVVTRLIGEQIRVETYDALGTRTGHHDDWDNPSPSNAFLESDVHAGRLLVGFGQHRFYVLEARVDEALVPIIAGTQELHDDWDQGIDFGIYDPPYHPRVSAVPARFVGHRDLITFALSTFGPDDLRALAVAPTEAKGLPYNAYFDAAAAFVVWEEYDNVRSGWLLDDGTLLLEIDLARGAKPAIALGDDGPGIVFLRDGALFMSELAGVTLQCAEGRFCQAKVDAAPIEETAVTAMGLDFDASRDSWVIAASEQLLVVGRDDDVPMVQQARVSKVGDGPPRRIDVQVSGGTAAVVQSDERGDSALTFMGCF